MSTGIKQADGTYCYAADPNVCKNHKPFVDDPSNPFAAVEAAMLNSESGREMRAYKMMLEYVVGETKAQRSKSQQPVPETIHGYRDYTEDVLPHLKQYNADYQALAAQLDESHLEALKTYTAATYGPMNRYLKDKAEFRKVSKFKNVDRQVQLLEEDISTLDQIFDHAPARTESRTLYRVIDQKVSLGGVAASAEEYSKKLGLEVGKIVQFPGYSSTSIDPHIVTHMNNQEDDHYLNVVLIITSKQSIPVASTPERAEDVEWAQDSEREILLPRNSRFKVVSSTTDMEFTQPEDYAGERPPVRPLVFHLEEVE
jgi:hypothetical protein